MSTYYDDGDGFGGTKRFPAKFTSKCPICSETVREGTMVEMTPPDESPTGKWQMVGHPGCKGKKAAAPTPAEPAAPKPRKPRAKKGVEVEIPPGHVPEPKPLPVAAVQARANAEVLWNGDGKKSHALDSDQDRISRWRPADGNVRVLAAAGSGKTRTTVALISRLIWDEVFKPGQIVCTTFTKKAGLELVKRFTPVLPPGALDAMRVGTFHSIAGKAAAAAYPARFKWGRNIDVAGGAIRAHTLWRQIFGYVSKRESESGYVRGTDKRSLELRDDEGRMVNVRAYALAVDVARSAPGDEDAVARRLEAVEDSFPGIIDGWRIFCEAKRNQGWWDFADTLQAYEAGLRAGEIRDGVKLIVIDEAQDNNPIQFAIGQHLAKRGAGNIILVGDVRQSIYSWRGAEPEIMIGADETIGAKTLEIPTNYRSVRKVVELGNRICEGEPWAIGSPATPKSKEDGILTVRGSDTAAIEAAYIANEIAVAVSSGARKDYSEVAILTRTNAQGASMEAALVARRIPAVVVGGTPFFSRVEPKAVLAWLRLLDGVFVADDVSRAVGFPATGLGEAYATDLWNAVERGASLYDAVDQAVSRLGHRDPRRAKASDFAARVQGLLTTSDEDDARRWRMRIDALAGMFAGEAEDKIEDEDGDDEGALASAVLDLAKTFDHPEEFFQFARQCAGEEIDPKTGEPVVREVEYEKDPDTGRAMLNAPILPPGRVVVSTIHKAKGLEWPVVYVSATRGLFPHRRSDNVAEEQRLFYVAVTRAEKECHLTFHVESELKSTGGPSSFLRYAAGLAE